MAKHTTLFGENLTLTTGTLSIAAIRTAAAGSLAAKVRVTRLEIWQVGTTTLAMIRGEMATRDTAGTLTMTSQAPKTIEPVGGAVSGLSGNTAPAGGDGRSGINASVDSGGAFTTVRPFGFANLNGYLWKPDPKEEILIEASTVFVFRFLAAPATLTGWGFAWDFEEN